MHCIVGPNGVGKSTLLRTIAGIIAPISGDIVKHGRVGYLGHNIAIYNQLTFRENLRVWSSLLDNKPDDQEIYKLVDMLDAGSLLDRIPTQFSKGQFQKAGLIRSFIGSPEIIILDEPTSGFDPTAKQNTQEVLLEYAKTHCVIVSSHDINEVSRIASNIILLSKNKPVTIMAHNQIYNKNASAGAHKVGILLEPSCLDKAKELLSARECEISETGWIYVSLGEGEVLGDLLKEILSSGISLLSVDDSSFIRSLYSEEARDAI